MEPEVPEIVMTLGDEVEMVMPPAPTMDVVPFERPLMAVMPLPVFSGTQLVPFQVRTWFAEGAVEDTALPSMPMTVWDVELPERSPAAVKFPLPQPTQLPETTRFWSVVVEPEMVTLPGKVTVIPEFPIWTPVACEAPIVTVPVASKELPVSPVMPLPLKVRDANATETPTARIKKRAVETKTKNFLGVIFVVGMEWASLVLPISMGHGSGSLNKTTCA